jgi:hypothetical protein
MEELPHKLKMELAMAIYAKMFQNVKFFKMKQKAFVIWVGQAVRPMNVQEEEYVFKEGEKIIEMYFIVGGAVSYVLPRYNHKRFIEIE